MKSIGFTGTQQGMTAIQKTQLQNFLRSKGEDHFEFHHGDCVGADSEAHDIAQQLGAHIVIHPPENPRKRAYRKGNTLCPTKSYLQRNHDIVDASDLLIATPSSSIEKVRSGTWATIRYAKKQSKPTIVISP